MPDTYVALDVETTGLDPETDRVTEVAAVRFRADGTVLESFRSFVNPGREIPLFVESLTGISGVDVADAPPFGAVAVRLQAFAGHDPIVGHNVGFDLACLEREGLQLRGAALDTAALSRVLLPTARSHALGSLAADLGIDPGASHRALDDALTSAAVFADLARRAAELPLGTRLQLARLVGLDSISLAEVVAGRRWDELPPEERVLPGLRSWAAPPALAKSAGAAPVSRDDVQRAFAAGPAAIAGFEERAEQVEASEAVGRSFAGGGHWLIEAGTGVGKSLAYLVPAAIHALRSGERAVISTNTIALQDQLFTKDIPALRALLVAAGSIEREDELRVALLKGRANYLCVRRWLSAYAGGSADPDFARLAPRVALWLPGTETGDRAELSLDPGSRAAWSRFSAQDADCLARQDSRVRRGECFLARARKTAEAAHIVVVNHALLLADLVAGGSAVPGYEHLVIDEAHNLEEVATRQFGRRVSDEVLAEALGAFWRPAGREGRASGVAALLRALPAGEAQATGLLLTNAVAAAARAARPLFELLGRMAAGGDAGEGRLRVTGATRASPDWDAVDAAWGATDAAIREVTAAAQAALDAVAGTEDGSAGDEEDLLASTIEGAARRLEALRLGLEAMVSSATAGDVVWVASGREGTGSLNSAPLDPGPLLAERLFAKARTVVATSATLSAAGSMAYMAQRLGLYEAETLQVGSPFDYQRSALLAEVTGLPEPGQAGYGQATAEAIARLVSASDGRALVLFTSHSALRDAASRVRAALGGEEIAILAQDEDGTPRQLIDLLRTRPRTAVFGTSSFWEGVDVRGRALSLLVIARLPFSVPTDPVHEARAETYVNPFSEYSLPGAILRFRQGFGRLIRDKTDRGVVAVLDGRLTSRQYGPAFIAALPGCARFRGRAPDVAAEVRAWLAR